ncbi:MAG TPA: response regulator [Vicinamibacterales bacterium]|nr:response regulator [Vicinamibacterales bacterium]
MFPRFRTAAAGERAVLIADDDRDTRELYRACFDLDGYRTAEAETGSQTLAAAIETVPDVLVTDLILPDIDGFTLAERLKEDRRTSAVRVVVVTAYAAPDLERRAVEAGVERVLLKPCLPQAMLREVTRVLARRPQRPRRPRLTFVSDRQNAHRTESTRPSVSSRIRGEFAALPGLALTTEQARLVFDVERETIERVLHALVAEGFLALTPEGAFQRPFQTRQLPVL